MTQGRGVRFNVQSEIGQLRQVILHRPGLELSRLTPENIRGLLFDDVLWEEKAREEHDSFAEALRQRGVRVHYYADLLAEALRSPGARDFLFERVCSPEVLGPTLVEPVRRFFEDLDHKELVSYLIGGLLKQELHPDRVRSLRWDTLGEDDFLLTPLPNHLFPRDNSSWIYNGVSINPMAKPARQRESLHTRTIYRFHPLFSEAEFVTYYGDDDDVHLPASIEGGDVHVIGKEAVMIGMGERTSPMGVEILARRLFTSGEVRTVIAVELPKSHSMMHLDALMTMVDHATFVVYPYLDTEVRSWTLTQGEESELHIEPNDNLWASLATVLEVEAITVLTTAEDIRQAERAQWNDATNYLAVSPGVVFGYDRNVLTNVMLESHGIEVVTVESGELGRGRGGPRCMTCPIERD